MVAINENGPSICEQQISMFERTIEAKLSGEYRSFLLATNGGIPVSNLIEVDGLEGSPTDVQVFFGIGREVESSDLKWNFCFIAERCPEFRLLPIACDSGGNLFCFRLRENAADEVVYCVLDTGECSLYPVAFTFGAFMKKLVQVT